MKAVTCKGNRYTLLLFSVKTRALQGGSAILTGSFDLFLLCMGYLRVTGQALSLLGHKNNGVARVFAKGGDSDPPIK
ncbi:hypothetical protein [uncultured Roseobacter sp.]|uniref:hypothetical protein n=1 Tax=uncultured Roseobacter sp. TaxID=114847 RepID=UPI002620F7BF|nr:hypothetical protein [uncultured Roseobacter sp.]